MSNVYSSHVKNAINYFLDRTGQSIVYKRLRNKDEWSPTALGIKWWEWITANSVIYDATLRDTEESGGRLRLGDKAFLVLNSIFTDHSGLTFIYFDTGAVEFTVGETLTGAIGGATGVVVSWYESDGTWAGDDAKGGVYVSGITGAFQAEEINGSVGGDGMAESTAASSLSGDDDTYPEVGDEISYGGKTYYVNMEGIKPELRTGTVIREDITKSTTTIWGRAKNV